MTSRILIFDKDIKLSIFFMTSLATILESLRKKVMHHDKYVDMDYLGRKLNKYEVVFDAVAEDFNDSMFGLYSNSVTR